MSQRGARFGGDGAIEGSDRLILPPLLDYLEGQVPEAGGFLVEDRITLADIAVASPFVNLIHHLKIDVTRWPRTRAYMEAIHERPSMKRWVDKETRFFEKVRAAA